MPDRLLTLAFRESRKFLCNEIGIPVFVAKALKVRFEPLQLVLDSTSNRVASSNKDRGNWHAEYRFICECVRERRDASGSFVTRNLASVVIAEQLSHLRLAQTGLSPECF
jgi:hypothetical protein